MWPHMPVCLSRAFITLLDSLWNHSYDTYYIFQVFFEAIQHNFSISSVITSPFWFIFVRIQIFLSSLPGVIAKLFLATFSTPQLRFSTGWQITWRWGFFIFLKRMGLFFFQGVFLLGCMYTIYRESPGLNKSGCFLDSQTMSFGLSRNFLMNRDYYFGICIKAAQLAFTTRTILYITICWAFLLKLVTCYVQHSWGWGFVGCEELRARLVN